MKKLIVLSAFMFILVKFSNAQTLSVTGFGGYTFQDKVSFSNTYGYIRESGHWGVSVEGINRRGHAIELLFQNQMTHGPLYDYYTGIALNKQKNNLSISYVMLNGIQYFEVNPNISPYAGLGIGAGIVSANGKDAINQDYDRTETKFAWDIKAGIKIKTHSVVGFKLQAQLFSMVQATGGGFYAGTGGGGVYVSSYSTIYQFGFTGGLSFDFQRK